MLDDLGSRVLGMHELDLDELGLGEQVQDVLVLGALVQDELVEKLMLIQRSG